LYCNFKNYQNIDTKISYSYNHKLNKKNISINWKKATKKIYDSNILKIINFFPTSMNMFILWPKYRRDYIDTCLESSIDWYKENLKKYNLVLKSRNKILKNIKENKSNKDEINFWNNEFKDLIIKIYKSRKPFIEFISNQIKNNNYFHKNSNIDFIYESKIKLDNVEKDLDNLIKNYLEKEIILWKTLFWPHLDDFLINIDWNNISFFASRWEQKNIIIKLKLLEALYIEKNTNKKPVFLIDDIFSELDKNNLEIILSNLEWYQVIATSVEKINKINWDFLYL